MFECCGHVVSVLHTERDKAVECFSLLDDYFSTLFSAYAISSSATPATSVRLDCLQEDMRKFRLFLRPFDPADSDEASCVQPLLSQFISTSSVWQVLPLCTSASRSSPSSSSSADAAEEAFRLLKHTMLACTQLLPSSLVQNALVQLRTLYASYPMVEGLHSLKAILSCDVFLSLSLLASLSLSFSDVLYSDVVKDGDTGVLSELKQTLTQCTACTYSSLQNGFWVSLLLYTFFFF